jgi:Tol biopolymer transport system component
MRFSLITAVASTFLCVLVLAAPAPAAFPGENGKIAFSAWSNGSYEIYTVNPDGTGLTQLTSDPAWDAHPAWSADGRHIAFNRDVYIWVMDADGSNQRRVYGPLDYALGHPSWSPDGTELAISDNYYDDIFRIRADGQGLRTQVTRHDTNHSSVDPVWSPDGRKIAYSHYSATGAVSSDDIHVVNADGSGEVNLTPTPNEYEEMPNWSPDGRFIAIGDDVSSSGVRVMGADGSNRAAVPGTEADSEPAFSPDGTKLVASTFILAAGQTRLVTYARDGSGRTLIPGTEWADDPDWQPVFGPKRSDFENAAEFCRAEREFFGAAAFSQRYGGGANAYGKCVSGK